MEKPTIYEAMTRVMKDVGAIEKNQKNTHFRYNFRGIDDVMNALNGALVKHEVFYVPTITNHEIEKDGKTVRAIVHVGYTFYGPAGDHVYASGVGEGVDQQDKATTKALSMSLKYALLHTFCIPTEEQAANDPDAAAPVDSGDKPASKPKESNESDSASKGGRKRTRRKKTTGRKKKSTRRRRKKSDDAGDDSDDSDGSGDSSSSDDAPAAPPSDDDQLSPEEVAGELGAEVHEVDEPENHDASPLEPEWMNTDPAELEWGYDGGLDSAWDAIELAITPGQGRGLKKSHIMRFAAQQVAEIDGVKPPTSFSAIKKLPAEVIQAVARGAYYNTIQR